MAEFDMKKISAEMFGAVKDIVKKDWKDVKETADQFLESRKERLALLAELRLSGDLNDKRFKSRLEDEKLMLEAELNAVAVISKATAQSAANAAISVLESSVLKALGLVL
jgi:hypothetical protein